MGLKYKTIRSPTTGKYAVKKTGLTILLEYHTGAKFLITILIQAAIPFQYAVFPSVKEVKMLLKTIKKYISYA
ncbi:hypothetical protein OXIME_001117 [Oxyplasma meridianum]|uniref:Uncharacterized protein n=1 Tax=Oxyplasma meridianum TaxID=3073602 RepID=A0AAX4NGE9_9ARCH